MTFLTNWAKTIVYYLLFVKILMSLIPNGNMKKYIKLFSGILLIIILIQPLISIKSIDKNMFYNILKVESELDQGQIAGQVDTYQNINDNLAFNIYIKNTKDRIESIVSNEGLQAENIDIKVNEDKDSGHYGELKEVNLVLVSSDVENGGIYIEDININSTKENTQKTGEDILKEKNIKSELIDFYNVPVDNIHISIKH